MEDRHVALTAQSAVNATWRVVYYNELRGFGAERRRPGAMLVSLRPPSLLRRATPPWCCLKEKQLSAKGFLRRALRKAFCERLYGRLNLITWSQAGSGVIYIIFLFIYIHLCEYFNYFQLNFIDFRSFRFLPCFVNIHGGPPRSVNGAERR